MSTLYVNAGLVPTQKLFQDTIRNSWIIRNESCSVHYPSNRIHLWLRWGLINFDQLL